MDQGKKSQLQKLLCWIIILVVVSCVTLFSIVFLFYYQTPPDPSTKALLLIPASMCHPWDYNQSAWDRNKSVNVWNNPYSQWDITISNRSDADRFIRDMSNEGDLLPYFVDVSKGSAGEIYQNFTLLKTGNQYISEIWYFYNKQELLVAEKELYQYLEKSGNVSEVNLNFNAEISDSGQLRFYGNEYLLRQYPTTGYESDSTSGYFLVLENPEGLYSGYYIAYYGVLGPSDLKKQSTHIKILIFTVIDRVVMGSEYAHNQGVYVANWTIRGLNPDTDYQ